MVRPLEKQLRSPRRRVNRSVPTHQVNIYVCEFMYVIKLKLRVYGHHAVQCTTQWRPFMLFVLYESYESLLLLL